MIEIIKAAFTAGEVKTFLIQGEYVEILEAAYPVDVAMMDRSGAQLSTMRNAEASYFSRPGKYEVIQVTSASAQTIRLFVGSGDAGTRRLSGVVQVVDTNQSSTIAGKAFSSHNYASESAGNYTHVQLWNPAASGKIIVVEGVKSFNPTLTQMAYDSGFNAAQLTNLVNNAPNKLSSGVASVAQLRTQVAAARLIVQPASSMFVEAITAGNTNNTQLKRPFVLMPGYGFVIQNQSLNQPVSVLLEWTEEPI